MNSLCSLPSGLIQSVLSIQSISSTCRVHVKLNAEKVTSFNLYRTRSIVPLKADIEIWLASAGLKI